MTIRFESAAGHLESPHSAECCHVTKLQQMRVAIRHFAGTPVTLRPAFCFFLNRISTLRVWRTTCQSVGMKQTTVHPLVLLLTVLVPAILNAASLEPATSKAWEDYIASATGRMEQRLDPGKTFLWMDESPERVTKVRSGEIVVSPVAAQNPRKVPAGLIHDWIGASFIPNATLHDVLAVVRDYARYKELYRPAVTDSKALDSKMLANGEGKDRYSMRLIDKSLLMKTAFDIDFESHYAQMDDRRGYAVTWSTRIQEIDEYGAHAQQTLPEGEGDGVMWRLFSTTRYVERSGGVYLEIEVIVLSRDIPASLRWLVDPIVRRISRNTLTTSLRQTETAVRSHARLANSKTDGDKLMAATIPAVQ